jgi:Tfp pilus assembly protein PilE
MIGHVMATLHMLHITDIISPQYQQSMFKRRRPQGEATMRDVAPKMEHLPVKFVQLLTSLREKTNRSMPSMSLPETLTAEELRDRPTDAGVPDDDEEEGVTLGMHWM